MPGATRRLSNVNLLHSVSLNHSAGLLRDSMNDRRFSEYRKSLDRKGKDHCRLVEAIISSPSKMDEIKRAGDVLKLYAEAQRAVEADRASLADAWYSMSKLHDAIKITSKLSDEDRTECLQLLDAKLLKRTNTSEMALCVAIDPRQDFGRHEPDLMKQAESGLQERLKRLYDVKVMLMFANGDTVVVAANIVVVYHVVAFHDSDVVVVAGIYLFLFF